jgi:hypothetical protein
MIYLSRCTCGRMRYVLSMLTARYGSLSASIPARTYAIFEILMIFFWMAYWTSIALL